jgi:lipopolysaccharide heptosyltransferase I
LKILILKPSSLGDVVQALPVLRLLKRRFPRGDIYWWIDTNLAPLLENDPDLAGIIRFERRRWAAFASWLKLFRDIRRARAQVFDWVFDLQGLARSGAFAWLANGKLTLGLDTPREGARGFYDLAIRRPSYHTHAVDWYLGALAAVGVPTDMDFEWIPERTDVAKRVRQTWLKEGTRWILIQPGARWINKRWPAGHFAELVRQLATNHPQCSFAILGGPEDRPLGETITRAQPARCLDLTGKLSLPEMVECVRLSSMMITNDTGPMHVAAALRKPLVALFGPTEPRRTGPHGQVDGVLRLDLPCAPCMRPRCHYVKPFECLRALPPSAVLEAVRRRIAG